MKNTIVITVLAGFVSLGFTAANKAPKKAPSVKSQQSEKIDFSNKLDEKRLASWD